MKSSESLRSTASLVRNTTQPAKKLTTPTPAARKPSVTSFQSTGCVPVVHANASPKPAPRTTNRRQSLVTSGPKPTDLTKKVVKKPEEEVVDCRTDQVLIEACKK
jgi:hypothetical protein